MAHLYKETIRKVKEAMFMKEYFLLAFVASFVSLAFELIRVRRQLLIRQVRRQLQL